MINVCNKHHEKPKFGKTFYIGRGSPLGNPFSHKGYPGTTKTKDRTEAVACYGTYLRERIAEKDLAICEALEHMSAANHFGTINLMCFCAPLACHGDVIKSVLLDMED
jgi:hypothetical protein